MSESPIKFVLSDNTVNAYGFKVLTNGIDLSRMESNPVMLYGHNATEHLPIGKWQNIRVEQEQLLGEPIFDEADNFSLQVKGKVERGFLSSASIGFEIVDVQLVGEIPVVTQCILKEVSIVAVGANKNARLVHLSDGDNEKIKQLLNYKNEPMKEILTHFNLADNATALDVLPLIQEKEKRVIALEQELSALKKEQADKLEVEKKAILNEALSEKKVSQKELSILEKLELADLQTLLAERKSPPTLMGQLSERVKNLETKKNEWSFEDWRKNDAKGLEEMKLNDNNRYAQLFAEQYKDTH